ncbi:MAG: alpha-amylase family glycosyl hydrolase [Rhodobacterales bacterium]|nr:alpha-amylase family glycosyl hydrolase [Rhodobacterales bacterium]
MARTTKPKTPKADPLFDLRWQRGQRDLIGPLTRLYGGTHDVPAIMDRLRTLLATHWHDRPDDLRALDLTRDIDPDWFLSQDMVAYVFYIDKFAGTLARVPDHIPYLKDLGVSHAHFMPCLRPRPGQSDGGHAVMDYRAINPALGTMEKFETVAKACRAEGIDLGIDIVLNHTAREHEWASRAREGDPFYQAFYRMFDDDTLPKQYEKSLLEIFPAQSSGNFTYYPDFKKWVWTTFNEYQWDLNWENPELFLAILDTILHLANKGVTIFRLDAVAFMWKKMGTICQNLPEVHDLLQALVQSTRVAAPAVIHKAEAIVGPADLVAYLGTGRHEGKVSNLAHHNNLMVQFWSSLASRDTRLMTYVMKTHFPESFRHACFATYIRCHDNIGWAITPEDANRFPPMTDVGHRNFLADFYAGDFEGSFARGEDFQSNPEAGDRRTVGSFASLAGLERALDEDDEPAADLAIKRILMGHALIASFGGVPHLYMGDEIGLLNDYSFHDDPDLADDGRWMHRPQMDWAAVTTLPQGRTPAARIHAGTKAILATRKATPQLASHIPTKIVDISHPGLFIFERLSDDRTVTCLFNFSETDQSVTPWALKLDPARRYRDLLTGAPLNLKDGAITLPPYASLWLIPEG